MRSSRLWRWRRWLIIVALVALLGGMAVWQRIDDVAMPGAQRQLHPTHVLDNENRQLVDLSAQPAGPYVAIGDIPAVVVSAIVDAVDPGFLDLEHADVWRALTDATELTRRYIKELDPLSTASWRRGLQDGALALRMERQLGRRQVVERYLNAVYLGRGAFGISAASHAWFGKDVGALGATEASFLGGLVLNGVRPESVDPAQHLAIAEANRRTVLTRLTEQQVIDTAVRDDAARRPISSFIVDKPAPATPDGRDDIKVFIDNVRSELVARFGEAVVFGGGLTVTTTLDSSMLQSALNAACVVATKPTDPAVGLVAVDDSGFVRVALDGCPRSSNRADGAVLGAGATGRAPGGVFAPLVLAVSPTPASTTSALASAVTAADTTAVTTAASSSGADSRQVLSLATRLGLRGLQANASLLTGAQPVTLDTLAGAFTSFAGRGSWVAPVFVAHVADVSGRVLEDNRGRARSRVLSAADADAVTGILQHSVASGPAQAASFGRPMAGVLGVSPTDGWFVGYTPKLTAGVWIGYPQSDVSLASAKGRPAAVPTAPAEVWRAFMAAATQGIDTGVFTQNSSG